MAAAATVKRLGLDAIRTDGTQTRKFSPVTASEYAAAMSAGEKFPAAVVFFDGTYYWMSCGHHRLEACKIVEAKTIECDVREGTQFEALCFAIKDNDHHGLRVTNEDKRFRTRLILEHPECSGWSDRRIAEIAGVDHKTVGKVRDELGNFPTSKPPLGNLGNSAATKTCHNCGGESFTDDGDCAKCFEPCAEESIGSVIRQAARDALASEPHQEQSTRLGRDGKQYQVAMRESPVAPRAKVFSASEHAFQLFDYLRDLAAKWPMEHRESLAKVLIQMSREVMTIKEAGK